jgi:hypothetical protein
MFMWMYESIDVFHYLVMFMFLGCLSFLPGQVMGPQESNLLFKKLAEVKKTF